MFTLSEYYGNGNADKITPITHEILNRYPMLKYNGLPCADPIRNACLHFECLVYPTLLVQFIDFNGPRYVDKLENCDIKEGNDLVSISETSFTRYKMMEFADKHSIDVDMRVISQLDTWVDAKMTLAKSSNGKMVFKEKLALAILMVGKTRTKFFSHRLMNLYVEYRLKALTMMDDNRISAVDHLLVYAVIESNMM